MTPLPDTLFLELGRASAQARRAFSRLSSTSERRRQLMLLLHLRGELSHAALQGELDVDGATVTRLVKQIESEGSITRRLDPDDNRYTLVSLTESGTTVAAELYESRRKFQRQMLAGVGRDEQQTVIRVLEQVRANLTAITPPEGPGAKKSKSEAPAPRTG